MFELYTPLTEPFGATRVRFQDILLQSTFHRNVIVRRCWRWRCILLGRKFRKVLIQLFVRQYTERSTSFDNGT